MWHSFFDIQGISTQSAAENIARNANVDQRIEIDSKAMRKVSNNEILAGVIEPIVEAGVASFNFTADSRTLVKLA